MDKLFSIGAMFKIPQLAGEITKYVDTNMPPSEIMRLATLAARTKDVSLETGTYPGTGTVINGMDVLLPDTGDGQPIVDKIIWGLDYQANKSVTVEVLNGTGISGKAADVARGLASLGFQVTNTGTAAGTPSPSTVVVSHGADQAAVQAISRSLARLGITNVKFLADKKTAANGAMITITLGTDLANEAH